jgi:photosystem II stability/assembly factor-like uncharacterized protein
VSGRLAAAILLLTWLDQPGVPAPPRPAWARVTTGVTARLRGLSAVSPQVVWASGTGGTVIRTADGGKTWTALEVPGAAEIDFRDIDAVDARTAYVLSIGNGDASRIYKTADAGRTWTLQFRNSNPRAFFDAMAFRDARHGFAVSDAVDGKLIVIRTDDGGAHWRPVDGLPNAVDGEGAFAASGSNIAIAGNHVWIATSKSRVFRSADNGSTWSVAPAALPTSESAGIFSVAFAGERRGIVVGGDYKAEALASDNAAITADGGATWTVVKGVGGYRSAVVWLGESQASAPIVATGPGGTDYSLDGGATWTAVDGGFHTLSAARGSRVVWAAGEGGAVAHATF